MRDPYAQQEYLIYWFEKEQLASTYIRIRVSKLIQKS